ncbi:glutathione S-transferase N-terminal domain-containing protein [Marinobacterium sp. D7]|uniref:glutathione S-transferase family protein n=1 Tax=Marinobacterium ramblicola TaxID=2849041 RepID=UPI001C2CFDAC|nr:glutathione S-transferase N-terminal domain-containing protein [Marinobacterium ramblicola]MBV1788576.1 glutathione S-transferase N-terminal domain-containing protein [Marinobacterium ramblicola]
MIDLYTWSTPNGRKVSIMLEACRLHYSVHPVDIKNREQFEPEFLTISPNNKIPAIVDEEGPEGKPVSLFESGAILIYLAEKCGQFMPDKPCARYEVLQWLMWQMGSFGPYLGQAHHFNRFAPEKIPYAIERYNQDAQRLWGVLDKRLAGREFVVDELSIADFAIYPWACRHEWQMVELSDFPAVAGWMARMARLPFVERGMQVP